ncbi:MAG: hypothetical protein WBA09_21530, partial [Candidatus Acidiferrum sp.]
YQKAPISYIEEIKKQIVSNCEELIETGARIRPLLVGGKQVGWVRGLHLQERLILKRWIKEPNDFVANSLLLATSLTSEEIDDFTAVEVRSLAEVVRRMMEYDMSLFPYLSAYVTTQSSENLWYGQGEKLTSYENKIVHMPDGKQMKILVPPDHARMWASLCTYREQAKRRLDDNFNSLFIVRPWAGRSADPVSSELKGVARSLETDSMEPWERMVRLAKKKVDDGWAHAGDSVEDLRREMEGMLKGDRHERLMEIWQKQMETEAEETKRKLTKQRAERRGDSEPGVIRERHEVFTDKQIKERQAALKKGTPPPSRAPRADYEIDPAEKKLEKFKRYR